MWFTISHREQRLSETFQFSSVEKAVTCKWVRQNWDMTTREAVSWISRQDRRRTLNWLRYSEVGKFPSKLFVSGPFPGMRVSHLRLSCSDFPIVWRTHKLLGCFIFSTIAKVWWPITANSKIRILMDELFYFLFYCLFFYLQIFFFYNSNLYFFFSQSESKIDWSLN